MRKSLIIGGALCTMLAGGPAVADEAGKAIYDQYCMACHAMGVAGAPKMGDAAAWADRIAKGNDALHANAISGYQGEAGMMPPKGGFNNLSDDEVKAGVDYMVEMSQ